MAYSDIFDSLYKKYSCLDVCKDSVYHTFDILKNVYRNGGKVLLCGNGGSAADCEHIVGELMKGFKLKRPVPCNIRKSLSNIGAENIADYLQGALPAISLVSQTSLISAFANDINYNYIFAQQVYGYGKQGDALIAISTSGNSESVINAAYTAKSIGLYVIGMTGDSGGLLKHICNECICVPFSDTASVQEHHLPIYHALCAALEEEFFKED